MSAGYEWYMLSLLIYSVSNIQQQYYHHLLCWSVNHSHLFLQYKSTESAAEAGEGGNQTLTETPKFRFSLVKLQGFFIVLIQS